MYCSECGMENGNTEAACRLCQADLKTGESFVPEKVYCDITRIPLPRILKNSMKHEGWGKTLLNLPIFTIIYIIRKISRTPWPSPMFNSRKIQYKPTRLESIKNLDKKKIKAVSTFLAERGYQFLMDYELVGLAQDNQSRLMVNPHDKTHAVIAVNGAKGTVKHVTFIGIWKNYYYSLTNGYGLPVEMGENVNERYEGGFSLEKTHRAFLEEASEIDGQRGVRKKVSLANLFRLFRRLHQFNIKQGIRQGVYISEKDPGRALGTGAVGSSTCYHHPTVVAVRECTGCGHPLCESCAHMMDGKAYCEKCLPVTEAVDAGSRTPAGPLTGADPGVTPVYAGFGIRLAAFVLDIALIGLLMYAAAAGGGRLLRFIQFNYLGPMVLLGLVLGSLFTTGYFVLFLQKSGRTLGHRVFGLRVVDETGQALDIRAAVIRFGYYLISLIFIFPLLGFLAVIFNKRKQGWHDRLAGTFVVGRKSWPRIIGAWVLILGLTGSAAWGLLQTMPGQIIQVLLGLKDTTAWEEARARIEPQLLVEPVWTYTREDGLITAVWKGAKENNLTVVSRQGPAALEIFTGKTIWNLPELKEDWSFFGETRSRGLPLLMIHRDKEFLPDQMLAVNGETGRIIWKNTLRLKKRQFIENMQIVGLYDEKVVVIVGSKTLSGYRMADGEFLWDAAYDEGCSPFGAWLNGGVILNMICGKVGKTLVMDEMNGNTLWKMPTREPWGGLSLIQGYQLVLDEKKRMSLVYLPEKHTVWKTDQPVAPFAQGEDELNKLEKIPKSLAVSNVVMDMESGRVLYHLPAAYQSLGFSEKYGLFYNAAETVKEKGENAVLLLVDKESGQKLGEFPFPAQGLLKFAGEDDGHLYLFFDQILFEAGFMRVNFFVTIDKSSLAFDIRKIGQAYLMDFFEYLPNEKMLLISGEGSVGLYEPPATATSDPGMAMDSGKSE